MNIKELKEIMNKEDNIYIIYEYIINIENQLKYKDLLLEQKDKEIQRLNELIKETL